MKRLLILLTLLPFTLFAQNEQAKNATIEQSKEYKRVFIDDGGTLKSDIKTKAVILAAEKHGYMDNTKFLWVGESAYKSEASTIYDYYAKLYDISDSNYHAIQSTRLNQPYVSGNIAPTEHWGMKNPNGDARYVTHPEISFAANEAWSVTTVVDAYKGDVSWIARDLSTYRFRGLVRFLNNSEINVIGGALSSPETKNFACNVEYGKNKIVTVVCDGSNWTAYLDGESLGTQAVTNSEFTFRYLLQSQNADFTGTISYHRIQSGAMTADQVAAEHALLQEIYPEIPSVKIGTQEWATSNFEAVATPMGNVIQEVQADDAVEKVINGTFDTDTDWVKGTGWSIGSGVASCDGTQTSTSFLTQSGIIPQNTWYKIVFEITSYTAGNIRSVFGGFSGSYSEYYNSTGTYTRYAYSSSTTGTFQLAADADFIGSIDNVSVEQLGWANSTELYNGLIAQEESEQTALQAAAMWCYYQNDSQLGAVYGKLYNWYAVKLLQNDIDTYNAANPDNHWGWHVPTQAEFTTLANYLGGASVAGGKMKVEGEDYWDSPNTGADNSSGFSLLGEGVRVNTDGDFAAINAISRQWTIDAYTTIINSSSANFTLSISAGAKGYGRTLRLLKD